MSTDTSSSTDTSRSSLQASAVRRSSSLRAEHDAAVQAAQQAAVTIRARAGAVDERRQKDVNDYVTQADERAQEVIVAHLTEAFPNYDVLAEEGANLGEASPQSEGPRWIIDPIDGTTNFMHAVPPYAVSIALQRGGEIDVGVVLDVSSDELYTAVRGEGAYLDGAPIAVSQSPAMQDAVVATGFPYRIFDHLERYTAVLRDIIRAAQGVRRHGAASVDLARVAAGRFGAFFETGLRPWDVAAGALLVREAGGRVTDYCGRSVVDGEGFLFGGQILATGGPLHDEMLTFVEELQVVRQ